MAKATTAVTAAFSGVVGLGSETRRVSSFYHLQPSVAFPAKPNSFKALKLKQSVGLTRRIEHRPFVVRCEASSNGRVKSETLDFFCLHCIGFTNLELIRTLSRFFLWLIAKLCSMLFCVYSLHSKNSQKWRGNR